ncbi:unnamed protein product [Calicophoron daubneyi]|uniref:Hexosyltransferase n=1 Tax=Calicophoron daubneyi TaxID=300641 RepID=A0AAV2U1W0_CALDB
MYLWRLLRKRPISLMVSLQVYLILIYSYCEIHEVILRTSISNEKVLKLTPKLIRWIALGQLNGKLFYNSTISSECSSRRLTKGGGYKRKYPREYKFGGSELFNYPLHVDVVRQVCRFKQGKSVAKGSYKNRDFPLLIGAEGVCPENVSEVVDILILIKSSVDHTAERKAIRNSWGNQHCWPGRKIRLVFVVAFTYKSNQMDWITRESQKYGDIIQQQFTENYHNNTHKFLFGLRWGLAFCPGARWYLFVDDDFFINPLSVLRFLDGVNPHLQSRVVAGSILQNGVVVRGEHKWGIDASKRFRVFRSLMALHGKLDWKKKSWIWKRLRLNRQCNLRWRRAIESS